MFLLKFILLRQSWKFIINLLSYFYLIKLCVSFKFKLKPHDLKNIFDHLQLNFNSNAFLYLLRPNFNASYDFFNWFLNYKMAWSLIA